MKDTVNLRVNIMLTSSYERYISRGFLQLRKTGVLSTAADECTNKVGRAYLCVVIDRRPLFGRILPQ
jgi:hypothetical protein